MVGRQADVLLSEPEIAAHVQHQRAGDRIGLGGERRIALEARNFAHGNRDRQIDAARLDRRHARRRILDHVDDDPFHRGLRSPVRIVPLQHDAAVHLILGEFERAGADRRRAEARRADLRHVGLGHDIIGEKREPWRRGRHRRVEMHDGLGRRQDFDVGQMTPDGADVDLFARPDALDVGIAEVLGGHLRAVVERHVVAKLERQRKRVVGHFPSRDELRREAQIGRLIERLIEHELIDRLRVGYRPFHGVPGRDVHRPADREFVLSGRERPFCARQEIETGHSDPERLKQNSAIQLVRHDELPHVARWASPATASGGLISLVPRPD